MIIKLFLTFAIFLFALPVQAFAATLSLSPASAGVNRGCNFSVDINIDTGGQDTAGSDVILRFDPAQLSVTSLDTTNKVYSDYPSKTPDNSTGTITISGLASVDDPFNGTGKFTTINFLVNSAASTGVATQVNFDFDPANPSKTTDTNIVEAGTVEDILTQASGATYTIGSGACSPSAATPTPAPRGAAPITIVNPPNQAPGTYYYYPDTQVYVPIASSSASPTLDNIVGGKPGFATSTILITIVGGFLVVAGILGLAFL